VSGGVLGLVLGWVYRRGIKSVAIGGDLFQSVAISAGPPLRLSTRLSVSRQSVAINQWQSVPDCSSAFSRLSVSRQSVAISDNQWQTVAISGNHFPPGERVGQRGHVARAQSVPLSVNQCQPVSTRARDMMY
jgi:hypothetical protein